MQQVQHPKPLILLIVFMSFSVLVKAQTVKNINPKRIGDEIIVEYEIDGVEADQLFDVSLYVSRDGGETFEGPLEAVRGHVGKNIKRGKHQIVWNVYEDVDALEGDIVFNVKARLMDGKKEKKKEKKEEKVTEKPVEKEKVAGKEKEEITREIFISYIGSLDAPIGLTVGQLGKPGWYVSARTGTNLSKPEYTYGGANWNPGFTEAQYYEFNSTEDIRRLSITGGLTYPLGRNFFMYTGIGYGLKDLLWQIEIYDYDSARKTDEEYVRHPDYSYAGVEVEAGFILRMGSFLLEGGVTSVNFKYTNVTLGVGLAF